MPIYEYTCQKCGHTFEKMLSFGAKPPKCPKCSSTRTRKLISTPAVHFKGGGFTKAAKKTDNPKCEQCPLKKKCEEK